MKAITLFILFSVIEKSRASTSVSPFFGASHFARCCPWGLGVRGGDADTAPPPPSLESETVVDDEEPSLDEKVQNAMKKLGLTTPVVDATTEVAADDDECKDGVCPMPDDTTSAQATTTTTEAPPPTKPQESVFEIAERIASEMGVAKDLALAALGASAVDGDFENLDEAAARSMIEAELQMIASIPEESEEVQTLVSEGYDVFHSRRALAFAESNLEDARAILLADQMDAEEEEKERAAAEALNEEERVKAQLREEQKQKPIELTTINVDSDFDPTKSATQQQSQPATIPGSNGMAPPKPAKKSDVVFECTTADLQTVLLESPVPCLVDVYADWCGPCKALTPVLEEMAIKAGGAFRLVKINSDQERAASTALEVTALPTIFAVRDGQILNSFQGMPRSEDMMRDFMMGLLIPGQPFKPPLTTEEKAKYRELSSKLAKTAGAGSFSFSARERMQDRMQARLGELVEAYDGDMSDAEGSARVVRTLLSNVIRNPFDAKFRRINLANKVIAAKVGAFPPCISMLKMAGFVSDGPDAMVAGKGKKVVNVAPLTVARDCIDKWIDRNRHAIAKAARKRKDELARVKLAEERANQPDVEEEEEEEEEEEISPDLSTLKVRMDGKNKVHQLTLHADERISAILTALPVKFAKDEEVQIVCAGKRLVVKSTDPVAMEKTLRDHGLHPAAAIVVKRSTSETAGASSDRGSSMRERAEAKKRKKGSHTMQSIGIYAKDDNAKGELVDGGGGVLYEQDVTDSEDEGTSEEAPVEDDGPLEDAEAEAEGQAEEAQKDEEQYEYDEYESGDESATDS